MAQRSHFHYNITFRPGSTKKIKELLIKWLKSNRNNQNNNKRKKVSYIESQTTLLTVFTELMFTLNIEQKTLKLKSRCCNNEKRLLSEKQLLTTERRLQNTTM